MKILVGCEESGTVRDAFLKKGHKAVSCDLLPSRADGPHLQCDVLSVLDHGWDLALFFPDCQYLSVSGLHWNTRIPGRELETMKAVHFVKRLLNAPIPRICLENPISCISTRIRPPDQIIQPWQFGEDASKATCLWLKGLPILKPTRIVPGRLVNGKPRWSNQTDSGQNRLGPSPTRPRDRAVTYPGIARAMAAQWGK